ncbi:hypothetical protein SD377_000780 [Cronobacter turicensis]|nr:hypothetical protein [Cronobacter turicensis]EMA1790113.1 hypothetical protein [Cronobacter turicensis]EMA1800177.1 hypothetical protein [Cronobacter turicensis]EMA1847390.1 hypothetical protein [Cronobacter turicensis]EMA1857635.1 hypothetical protein [Cronobacter turicensis]
MRLIFMLALFITGSALADSQCGPFKLGTSDANDGWARINGVKPDSQKFTFLKANGDYENVKMQWMVQRSDAPGWFGMDYIKRNGKAVLYVEAIRSNMDHPRVFGSFNCDRIN